jgi:hypothetical protein
MKDLGALFIQVQKLCEKHGARFEDYIERIVKLDRNTANTVMKIHSLNINPTVGYENMKILSRVREPEERKRLEEALEQGQSPDMIKHSLKMRKASLESGSSGAIEQLLSEKQRLERTITSLRNRLTEIEKRLKGYEHTG